MGRRNQAGSGGKRWLGEGNSWRRVVSTGIAGGIVLAVLAALVGSLLGGGSGSLDDRGPTVVAPAPVVPQDTEPAPAVDTVEPTTTDAPANEPTATLVVTVEPSPTLPVVTEPPTPPDPTPTATGLP